MARLLRPRCLKHSNHIHLIMPHYSTNYQKMKMKKDKVCAVCGMKHESPKKNFRFVGCKNGFRFWYYKNLRSGKILRLNKPLWTKRVVVHHIDGNPENDDPKNLIYLCDYCHTLAHLLIIKFRRSSIPQKWVREGFKKEIQRRRDELDQVERVIKRHQQNIP